MPWLRNEDSALKFKLQGILVEDANAPNGGREVGVRYRLPETELGKKLTYPIIVVEHVGLFPAPEREHRGYIQLQYSPEGLPIWWNPTDTSYDPTLSPYYTYYPVPYNFDYMITVYTRSWVEHSMPIMAQLATYNFLPYHFGFLNIPQDGTVRTMQLMGGPEVSYGKDEEGKRRYETRYRVRIFSELLGPVVTPVPVTDIHLDLSVYESITPLMIKDLEQSMDIKTAGLHVSWNTNSF